MNDFLVFVSEHYLLMFALGVGLLMTQSSFPIINKILGADNITAQQAAIAIDDGAILLDFRSPTDYKNSHVKGAKNISLTTLTKKTKLAQHIIIAGYNDETSITLINKLKQLGAIRISVLFGGFAACKQHGFVIVKG